MFRFYTLWNCQKNKFSYGFKGYGGEGYDFSKIKKMGDLQNFDFKKGEAGVAQEGRCFPRGVACIFHAFSRNFFCQKHSVYLI